MEGSTKPYQQVGYVLSTPEQRDEAARDVIAQLRRALDGGRLIMKEEEPNEFGRRFVVKTEVTGPSRLKGTLKTFWILKPASPGLVLITNWLEVHSGPG